MVCLSLNFTKQGSKVTEGLFVLYLNFALGWSWVSRI